MKQVLTFLLIVFTTSGQAINYDSLMVVWNNRSFRDTIRLNALNNLVKSYIMTKTERNVLNEISFEMRLGIHTGPVVAGIVGVKKFQYDVWGDTTFSTCPD